MTLTDTLAAPKTEPILAPATETGALGIYQLKRMWSRAIGGKAGDLVIWHQALPHGASPNRGTRPRLVLYINMFPTRYEEQEQWI